MHVAILGGGLMGTASAFFLLTHPEAPESLKVTLIDRGAIGAGATVANFGNVRRQGRDLRQMALAHHSLSLWNRLETLLGCDVEFRAAGHVRAAFHQDAVQDMESFAEAAQAHGLDLELLDQAAARKGLVIRDHTPVNAVIPTASGFQIETPDEVIEADLLLNTAGAWGRQVATWLEEHASLTPYGLQLGVTEPLSHRILPVVGV